MTLNFQNEDDKDLFHLNEDLLFDDLQEFLEIQNSNTLSIVLDSVLFLT